MHINKQSAFEKHQPTMKLNQYDIAAVLTSKY